MSTLEGGWWSTSHPDRFTPENRHSALSTGGWLGFRTFLDM